MKTFWQTHRVIVDHNFTVANLNRYFWFCLLPSIVFERTEYHTHFYYNIGIAFTVFAYDVEIKLIKTNPK